MKNGFFRTSTPAIKTFFFSSSCQKVIILFPILKKLWTVARRIRSMSFSSMSFYLIILESVNSKSHAPTYNVSGDVKLPYKSGLLYFIFRRLAKPRLSLLHIKTINLISNLIKEEKVLFFQQEKSIKQIKGICLLANDSSSGLGVRTFIGIRIQ